MGEIRLPQHLWERIDNDRSCFSNDRRVMTYGRPSYGVFQRSWFLWFVRYHQSLRIPWPSDAWLYLNGEGQLTQGKHGLRGPLPQGGLVMRNVQLSPHATELLKARAIKDGVTSQAVLRRLVRQHFDGPPPEHWRVTDYLNPKDLTAPPGNPRVCKDCATRI